MPLIIWIWLNFLYPGFTMVYQLESAWHLSHNVSIDLSFVWAFLCEPNSAIKFSQTRIWKWHQKWPLFLSCLAENYSNLNFNEHEKAGNEVVLKWRFLLVNGKAKRAQKIAFKTLQQFLALRVSERKWKTITEYYCYFSQNFNRFL